MKDNIIGSSKAAGGLSEVRALYIIIRWASSGWEYEADQRHAELIVIGMNLERGKGSDTPGEDTPTWKLEEEEEHLDPSQATNFRGLAARANYLASDRTDIQYAVKECCRGMTNPQKKHWNLLKRLARYLIWGAQSHMEVRMARQRGHTVLL